VGLAQAAVDHAASYAREREQFGRPIADFQGIGFMLADMATQVSAARALTLAAARLKDAGRPFSIEAAKAKLFATDAAMRVTTDAIQVLGGYGYVSDHPVERWFREAKVLQIVEGTNQIQRLVISRSLARGEHQ
jgi:alkylation response protein AidB-like acyl-CoA dehydrogenase